MTTINNISEIFAKKLNDWYLHGFSELGDKSGVGIGTPVLWAIHDENFLSNPKKASYRVWENSSYCLAEDGSIMRTSIVGVLPFSLDIKLCIADEICMTTHMDPRCRAACTYIVVCVSEFAIRNLNIIDVMNKAKNYSYLHLYGIYKKKFDKYISYQDITLIDLNKGSSRSHVKNPLRCLIYALTHLKDDVHFYFDILQTIIRQGGDADTNATVVGGVLGAYFGFEKLLTVGIQDMPNSCWLKSQAIMFMNKFV
jgi:ADP-ribosylglycohydrolase